MKIIEVWATMDKDSNYVDIYYTKERAVEAYKKRVMGVSSRIKGTIQGWCIVDDHDVALEGTDDFYYTLHAAERELGIQEKKKQNISLRPEVVWFAQNMETSLEENDHKGHWQDETFEFLLSKAESNIDTIRRAIAAGNPKAPIRRAIHAANYLMMIADNARRQMNEIKEVPTDE